MTADTQPVARTPLTRDRVIEAAVALADASGISAVSMRKVGQELGVEAMSLYNHVDSKEDLLDGMAERVYGEILAATGDIEPPRPGAWQPAVRARILAAREVQLRHPWAPRVIESRTEISMTAFTHYEGLLRLMREGGFTVDLAHHALHALGSKSLGFSQELFEPEPGADGAPPESAEMLKMIEEHFPYGAELMAASLHAEADPTLGWCDDQTEFEFALDIILDGLERIRAAG